MEETKFGGGENTVRGWTVVGETGTLLTWTTVILYQGRASSPFDQPALGGTFWSKEEGRPTHQGEAGPTLLMNGGVRWV